MQRIRAYATPDAAELEAVYDTVHKLACVAQAFVAAGSTDASGDGSGGTSGNVRALQQQLRQLKAEAGEALTVAAHGEGV